MKLSKIVAAKYNISVRAAKDCIAGGRVTVDGTPHRKDTETDVCDPVLSVPGIAAQDPQKYLISGNGQAAFFEKPIFMHSERHRPDDPVTLEDIVKAYDPDMRLISRLDFSTDGVVAAIKKGVEILSVSKTYYAWVTGSFKSPAAIDNIIDADKRKKVKVTDKPGGNRTVFSPVKEANGKTLVKAEMEKAARHQLRAYLAYLGYPIVGDTLYGGDDYERILLHCSRTDVNGYETFSMTDQDFINLFQMY